MDLNLTKLLNSCKSENLFNTIKQRKHWISSKTLKSHKISLNSNKSQLLPKEISKVSSNFLEKATLPDLRNPKISVVQSENLSLLSKKVKLLDKTRLLKTPIKFSFDCSQQGKVCHTYALPKKLKTVKKESLEKLEVSQANTIERKVIVSRKVPIVKSTIFQIKDFSSKRLLRKNEFYKESYLRDLTEKYDDFN